MESAKLQYDGIINESDAYHQLPTKNVNKNNFH
jgi:hypothetical protein